MGLTIENMPDSMVKVCLLEHGISVCTYVSSHHLAQEKERQLRALIHRKLDERKQTNNEEND